MKASDRDEIYRRFHAAVDMNARCQLRRWLDTDTSKSVGHRERPGVESTGHRSGRRIVDLLGTRKPQLSEAHVTHMRKVAGYVARHLAQRSSGDVGDTRWRYSLMSWGTRPAASMRQPDPAGKAVTLGGTSRLKGSKMMTLDCERFDFAFMRRYRLPLAFLGIGPRTAWVVVEGDLLTIQFGLWRLRTPIDNVRDARRTGPYRGLRVIGPRLSLADRGVTFGTTSAAGVCIQFASAVPALLPARWLRHSGATVTVADPDRLVALLTGAVAENARSSSGT